MPAKFLVLFLSSLLIVMINGADYNSVPVKDMNKIKELMGGNGGSGEFNIPGSNVTVRATMNFQNGGVSEVSFPGTGFKISTDLQMPKGGLQAIEKMDYIDPKIIDRIKIGDERRYEKNGELSCIAFGREILSKGIPAFNACMKEMQLNLGKLRKNIKELLPCMAKCMGIQLGMLHPNGLFKIDYAKKMLSESVPKRFHDLVWKIWNRCVDLAKQIVENDPTCKTYKPVIRCGIEAALDVAAEAMNLCTDMPDTIKQLARSRMKSQNHKQMLDKVFAD